MTLGMPNAPEGGGQSAIEHSGRVVFVGANGTGKSRLGAWLERNIRSQNRQRPQITLLNAQRALTFPAEVPRQTLKKAYQELQTPGENTRRNIDPVLAQSNDFDQLLIAIFAAYVRAISVYAEEAKTRDEKALVKPADDILDELQSVWKQVFPHRELIINRDDQIIQTKAPNSDAYSGQQMSDGERVAMYLICHTLLMDQHSTILVDEPEIHIHPSIQGLLWNTLEQARPSCTFIYITHDLEFAASRRNAVLVLLTEYRQTPAAHWGWKEVGRYDVLPEALVLEILGSRKPTLFCEGDLGDLDQRVFEVLYPKYYVRPVGGCATVIDVVKGFRKNPGSHRLEPVGIIDPDDKEATHLAHLAGHKVFALNCAQLENVLVQEAVLRAVAKKLNMDDAAGDAIVATVNSGLLQELRRLRDDLVFDRANALVKSRLTRFKAAAKNLAGLQQGMGETAAAANPAAAIVEAQRLIDHAIADGTLVAILQVFRNKLVKEKAAVAFNKPIDVYLKLAIETLKDGTVVAALTSVLPPVLVPP